MVDSRQYWMDQVLRQVAEDDMNPEVLSRDYGDPRFSRRPMKPESKPYFGGAQPAVDFALSLLPQQQPSGVMVENPRTGVVEELMIEPMVAEPNSFKGMGRGKKVPKKKLTPKEIRAKKDKETIKKEQETVKSNKLFSDSLNHNLEIRELSRTQYDELINDGWKHQDIMNEHPVIPFSVRRKGREWLELDSSPTPKTKRKPFDEYTRDTDPEGYINPGDTELQKEFAEIASAQRGAPEKIMLKITNTARGMEREYTFISEHIGDLYNRMTQPANMDWSFDVITDKFKKVKLNLSPKSNATLPRYVKLIKEEMPEMVELLDEFADAHAAVDISTSMGVAKPVQLARDAAVAYGKLDLDEAVRLLKELEPYMEDRNLFKKAMFNFGR